MGIVFFLSSRDGFKLEPWFLVWVLMVLFFSILNGVIVSNTLLKPLFTLRDEIAKLSQRKERIAILEIDTSTSHPIEIRTLRQAFAHLLEALREENQKRGAFMATLVHDLKTPIIAANHALQAIEQNDTLSREERILLVRSIQQENQTLLALVQKMIDANRFEREDVELILHPEQLRPLVEAVIQRLHSQAREKQINISLIGDGSALVSKNELGRAVQNLLDNAIRYARTKVEVLLENGKITVIDDGAGLPTSLEQLTKPFNSERVQMAGREYTSGTGGLGLFIVHRIAELHGGRLEAASTGDTQIGAQLSIYLQATQI
ncbi:MAG: sensor histidine kinase [Deinococcales bacterium]